MKSPWVKAKLRGQASSKNLLPSEEFDMGGVHTVRGYDNRWVTKDNAFCANLELICPDIEVIGRFQKQFRDRLAFFTIDSRKAPCFSYGDERLLYSF